MKSAFNCWRRSPAYSVSIALVVALVVLANATAFSAVWGVLYKPLPYKDAQELVELRIDLRDIDFQVGLSHPIYAQLRQSGNEFTGVIGSAEAWQPRLDDVGTPWRVQRVTADFTSVLGVEPAHGRALLEDGDAELLLSDLTWRRLFATDPNVLGSRIRIGAAHYVITGVMPAGFAWPDSRADAWTRYVPSLAEREQDLAGGFGVFHVAARLAPGVSKEQAHARLESVLRNAGNAFLSDNVSIARPNVRAWRTRLTTGVLQPLLLLQAAALLLLLVAMANIANLTVERVTARLGDFAVRRALGARWKNLVQVVVADLLPPAVVGTLVGLILTVPALGFVRARGLLPDNLVAPLAAEWPLLAAALISAAIVVLAASMAGAFCAASHAQPGIGQSGSRRGSSLRVGMLVTQIAIATVLCGSAGLLFRSALALHAEERGFDASGVLMTQVDLTALEHAPAGSLQRLREAIERQPGVTHVALADMPPFGGAEFKTAVLTPTTDVPVEVRVASVDANYFEAMGIPLLAGQAFVERQSDVIPVVVDDLFRRQRLPTEGAVGTTIRLIQGNAPAIVAQIVGIVPTIKQRTLSEPGQPMLYLPATESPAITFLVTRTKADPTALAGIVQRELQRFAPGAILMFNEPLAAAIAKSTAPARSLTEMAVLLGTSTGLLCALGCFALVGAAANRRRAEVGLRMALGASPSRIQRLVLRQGAVLIVAGVLAGVLIGLLLAHTFADRLYRISPDDPSTWLAAALLIATLALIACWLPASRAARLSPTVALAAGSRQL